MIARYVRENRKFTLEELCDLFEFTEIEGKDFISKLIKRGVLFRSRINDDKIENSDFIDSFYFQFVGIVLCQDRIVKIYPKYLITLNEPINCHGNEPVQEMQLIMKVVRKYHKKKISYYNTIYNGDSYNELNFLGVLLFLLDDFFEHGIYSRTEICIEKNGEGEILWGKTVDEISPYVFEGRPYYFEQFTEQYIEFHDDYIRKLHEFIIQDCFKQLQEAQIDDIFIYPMVEFDNYQMELLGNWEYMSSRIQYELNEQYETRKQILLRTMDSYIKVKFDNNNLQMYSKSLDVFSFWGVKKFEYVWQYACQEVFQDCLKRSLGELGLASYGVFDLSSKLEDIVEKPSWDLCGKIACSGVKSRDTYELDILYYDADNKNRRLYIMDAKYYCIRLDINSVVGQPHMADITKQYFYQLAFKEFIKEEKINIVENCFLMPTEKSSIGVLGTVNMNMFLKNGYKGIKLRTIPAKELFEKFLLGQTWDINKLELEKV